MISQYLLADLCVKVPTEVRTGGWPKYAVESFA